MTSLGKFLPGRPVDDESMDFLGKICWGLRTFVRPDANDLIRRHFHIGSEILQFVATNAPGIEIPLNPLRPRRWRT